MTVLRATVLMCLLSIGLVRPAAADELVVATFGGTFVDNSKKCHAAAFDSRHSAAINCVNCHMPKRRTVDVPHAVMTDHLIQRRKPSDDRLETHAPYRGEVVPYYPAPLPRSDENALYVAVAQVKHNSNLIPGTAQLAAEIVQLPV